MFAVYQHENMYKRVLTGICTYMRADTCIDICLHHVVKVSQNALTYWHACWLLTGTQYTDLFRDEEQYSHLSWNVLAKNETCPAYKLTHALVLDGLAVCTLTFKLTFAWLAYATYMGTDHQACWQTSDTLTRTFSDMCSGVCVDTFNILNLKT